MPDNPMLPDGFLAMLADTGSPLFDGLGDTLLSTAPQVAVRVNPAKGAALPAGADRVEWSPDGFYLVGRPGFTFDPALHQGLYYVQDASSMAVTQAVAEAVRACGGRPLRYLDACAAPGGKTLGALGCLPAGSFVVANEYSRRRVDVLTENLVKWGAGHTVVTSCDASSIRGLDGFFDIIGADVPCSGEGMMRKEPEAVAQWSPGLVAECASLQRSIVACLWRMLRPGGWLVYSTCTFNLDENERVVDYLVSEFAAETVAVPALDNAAGVAGGIGTSARCYRFVPGRVRGEGQFVALLRKPGDGPAATPRVRGRRSAAKSSLSPICAGWVDGGFELWTDGDSVRALPAAHRGLAGAVGESMHIVSGGLEVAAVKGRDLVPSQALAMSTALCRDAFACAEVDAATALRYLERNAVVLPEGTPRGYVLLTCGGSPLGFVKNLGNRSNNLYPASWRILSPGRAPVSVLR
ncbi:MAG: rRNA cytosine-C5-methyltransferase [Bacteroidales bacterium]|nr:rRNA cytosine-C5-methyltransferase [Bacteroidales bacterium]